jgi:glycosyltransferase involved in cell wall biosynthesis
MKIVQIDTYDISGGAARAAYRLHRGLLQVGQDCRMLVRHKDSNDDSVFCISPEKSVEKVEEEFFLSVAIQEHYIDSHRTDISNTLFSLSYPGYDLSALPMVQEADIINLHWVANYQSPLTLHKLFALGKPVVWTLHDQWAFTGGCHYSAGCEEYHHGCAACPQLADDPFGVPEAVLKDKLKFFKDANLTIVTPSQWMAECARQSRLFKDLRIEVIPNSLETDVFVPQPKSEAKESIGISAETITLLFGGEDSNEKRKGFRELKAAIKYCLKDARFQNLVKSDKIKMICFGRPYDDLDTIGIPVVPLGYLDSDEKISAAYSSADIFILPSLEDNLPNTMLEAMSCGTPVVAFDVGGMPDVIVDVVTGRLVPLGDTREMGKAVLSLIFDPDKREVMMEKCRRKMREGYALDIQARCYLELYEELHSLPEASTAKAWEAPEASNAELLYVSLEPEVGPYFQIIYEKVLFKALKESGPHAQRQLQASEADRAARLDVIHKRDDQLAELRVNRDITVKEIHKRDDQLAELRVNRDMADQLAEVRVNRDMAVKEIHKRDARIFELQKLNEQVLRALPLVSIITPVLNGAKWIEYCIKSILNQDYPKIEHIIVDGGSTDETLEICQNYPHLIIHSQKDRGQSHAINKGFAMAQGEILAWLCADDEYEDGAVQSAVKAILSGHDVAMGLSRFIDADGNLIAEHPANVHPYYDHSMFLRFWKYNPISQPATFWTRKMWETCGPLRENLYFAMDYDLWLRMSQRSVFERVDAHISKYRIHPEAKCFADNYGSRIELIKVSRQYWPSRCKPGFWKLYFSYILTRSHITQHYSDGEGLLAETLKDLDSLNRWRALFTFTKAHFKHFATPLLPNYKLTLVRILTEVVGPAWFWRLGKKIWQSFRGGNK